MFETKAYYVNYDGIAQDTNSLMNDIEKLNTKNDVKAQFTEYINTNFKSLKSKIDDLLVATDLVEQLKSAFISENKINVNFFKKDKIDDVVDFPDFTVVINIQTEYKKLLKIEADFLEDEKHYKQPAHVTTGEDGVLVANPEYLDYIAERNTKYTKTERENELVDYFANFLDGLNGLSAMGFELNDVDFKPEIRQCLNVKTRPHKFKITKSVSEFSLNEKIFDLPIVKQILITSYSV